MFPAYLRILCSVFAIACLYICLMFSNQGFQEILQFKQLERVVESEIIGATNGEIQLRGIVNAIKTIDSPSAGVPSVYYRYRLEEEETDSDGNTSWRTREDYQKAVDFQLIDQSGEALALSSKYVEQINWQVRQSYQRTVGRYRYTEWRIEQDQEVSAFARAQLLNDEVERPNLNLHFDQQGSIRAIITNKSMSEVRADMGGSANLQIWAGVSFLGLATFFILFVLKVHRILAYLSILAFVNFSLLSMSGMKMLVSDISTGAQFVETRSQELKHAIQQLTEEYHQEAPAWALERISALSVNLLYLEQNFIKQNEGFPENLASTFMSIEPAITELNLDEEGQYKLKRRLTEDNTTRLSNTSYWWMGGTSIVFCLAAWFGIRSAKVKRLIENVTTSLSSGLSYGIGEVKGKLVLVEASVLESDSQESDHLASESPNSETENDTIETKELSLRSPLTKSRCAWYRYLVEEKKGSGKNSRWVTVQDDARSVHFACKDREGEVLIDADDAEIITRHKKKEQKGDFRYTEWYLKPSDKLYVLGQVDAQRDKAELIINKGDDDDVFIISNYSEAEVMLRKALLSMFVFLLSFSALFGAAILWRGMEGQFSATDYMAAGIVAPVFLGLLVLILHYNDLIFLRQRAQRNWANIQVSLKKRFDLIPQLERVFKAYLNHESELQNLLSEQRNTANAALHDPGKLDSLIQNENKLLNKARLVVEAYPELKANQMCSQLVGSITQLENEIALMRSGYNDACAHYNTRIQSFPDLFFARAFGFLRMELVAS